MNRALRMKNALAALLAIVLLIVAAIPANAANTAKQAEVRVKVGSKSMSINGEKIAIQSPFNSGKVAMVPLSVFTNTKGFGASVKLVNKTIRLSYLKHTVTMTKNSKAATVDGKKTTLPAAPVDKSGVTMAPAEAIAKALGLKVATDAKTKEIVLTGASAKPAAGNSIDSDAGKNKVGDSYYKWSMNMPTSLAQDDQWDKGSKITFVDVKGEFYMAVFVDEAVEELDESEQRARLMQDARGTVVDVGKVTVGKAEFQRIVTKGDGFFYEYRGIQSNGNFYAVTFGKRAKAKTELDAYKSLLDSFQTSFDNTNKSLKDLSIVKDGKIAFTNADYGLKLNLPVAWGEDYSEEYPSYSGPDESNLSIEVNSILAGDTVDAWIEREMEQLELTAVQDYWKEIETSSVTWNGIPAVFVKLAVTQDKKTWYESARLFAIKGNYKYDIALTYKQAKKDQISEVLSEMLTGMTVDFSAIERNFGQVPDEDDTVDLYARVTKTSKQYGYSVTVPKHWINGVVDMESDSVEFENEVGVLLMVETFEGDSLAGLPEVFAENLSESGMFELESQTNVTFAGTDAVKMEFSTTPTAPGPMSVTTYLFVKNGYVYMVEGILADVAATALNKKQYDDAFNSFKLN
ncbi:copper amine oxidase N-terminal domain-containing protein [Cohnella panacarvi]|uniref:copper amine oxidase N-terminal domain-containing protein n=1 Tax=Cohnella panacarvi TaxID=400776 RepID=UPI00047C349F|nr:copper amine oxidase N-terminal domain-containing protein [Cohnella panacarvi]